MMLHEIPRESKIKVRILGEDHDTFMTFHHLDGMYSYCTTDDGKILHLSVVTPLKKVNNYYEIE